MCAGAGALSSADTIRVPEVAVANLSAPWTERFRVPLIRGVDVAANAPTRGLGASNVSGTFQLHAWHVRCGRPRALQTRAAGANAGSTSPDGRCGYCRSVA